MQSRHFYNDFALTLCIFQSRPLQAKLWSQSDDSTVSELNDLSDEVAAVDSESTPSAVPLHGRPRQSEEEANVEHKIAMLISEEMVAAKDLMRQKHLGDVFLLIFFRFFYAVALGSAME